MISLPCGNEPLTTPECSPDCDEAIQELQEHVNEMTNKLNTIEEGAQVNPPVDNAMSDSSSNAVQNHVIKEYVDESVVSTEYTGISPITVSGTNISHDASGVTAGSYGNSSAQTPTFGGKFKTLYETVDAKGHVTGINAYDVTIPSDIATQSDAGLLSALDKQKLDNIPYIRKATATITAGQTSVSITNVAGDYDNVIAVNAYLYETATSSLQINQMWHSVAVDWAFFHLMNLSPPSTFFGIKVTLPQAYTEDILVVVYYE